VETGGLAERIDEGAIASVIALNLVAPLRLTRQVLPGMLERGRGHIVDVSSAASLVPASGISTYCATKAGLSHFTATLRGELKGTPIGSTTCTLGPVDTSMWDRVTDNPNFDRAQKRFRHLGLLSNVAAEAVASDIVLAVEKGRRHVRHPKRLSLTYALGEANRRITELALTGVKIER
jgi:short-subunit dehydrogenase